MTTATGDGDGDGMPLVALGRCFLPVPAVDWPSRLSGPGLAELPVAAGTPVHAVSDGRVVAAAAGITGEVLIRDRDERLVHYRRLLPSSVRVAEGSRVTAGELLGVVGPPPRPDDRPAVVFGMRSASDRWLDIGHELLGAADPDELFHPVPSLVVDPLAASPTPVRDPASPPPPAGPVIAAPAEKVAAGGSPGTAAPAAPARPRDRRGRRPADPRRIAAAAGPGAVAPPPAPVAAPTGPAPAPAPPPATAAGPPTDQPGGGGADRGAPAPVPGTPEPAPATAGPEPADTPADAPADTNEVFRKLAGRSRRRER